MHVPWQTRLFYLWRECFAVDTLQNLMPDMAFVVGIISGFDTYTAMTNSAKSNIVLGTCAVTTVV